MPPVIKQTSENRKLNARWWAKKRKYRRLHEHQTCRAAFVGIRNVMTAGEQ
jgi:2-polyprenyl-3-methyl-5-hydroxy-6-metoxy-1,4-benzoquinol methylase